MSRFFLCFTLLFTLATTCFATNINLYVKYEDNGLYQVIDEFNQQLEHDGLVEKYQLKPFLKHYPLHTTLYLFDIDEALIPTLTKKIRQLSASWKKFIIQNDKLNLSPSNYLMLDIQLTPQTNGRLHPLQRLSDTTVVSLNELKNPKAQMPDWLKHFPEKVKAFNRYGSPNVFFEFSPHFTLMAKSFKNPKTDAAFKRDMRTYIERFNEAYKTHPLTIHAKAIGIGYVNNYGQVTKEIASLPLQ